MVAFGGVRAWGCAGAAIVVFTLLSVFRVWATAALGWACLASRLGAACGLAVLLEAAAEGGAGGEAGAALVWGAFRAAWAFLGVASFGVGLALPAVAKGAFFDIFFGISLDAGVDAATAFAATAGWSRVTAGALPPVC